MLSAPDHPRLTKNDLFAHLAEGSGARLTVLTPNRRLANALEVEFTTAQTGRGLTHWETADIVPVASFMERLYEDALYSEAVARLPLLLRPMQEQLVWEDIINASEWGSTLLIPARTAEEARKAWMLAHEWRIDGMLGRFPSNEDAAAFAAWAAQYRRRTAEHRQTDAARLPDIVSMLLAEPQVRRPAVLVLYAFDILTPQLRLFLSACSAAGTRVMNCRADAAQSQAVRMPLASVREELELAACWARSRLEAAHGRPISIGIVVPDLEQRRNTVSRILSRVLQPGFDTPGAQASSPPFNLSLGKPLAQYPLVHAALGLLALAQGRIEFSLASRLVRSPFIGGGRSEAMARARLDQALRRTAPSLLTLQKLLAVAEAAGLQVPKLNAHLRALFEASQAQGSTRRALHDWAERFTVLLIAAGFPGERALDSAEFQTLGKWNETLGELAALSRVAPAMSAQGALSRLTRLCADILFQPESKAAPIQVLGVLESAGLQFDHLWICGLTDEAWPLASRPNPFIPPALQKKAGVPEAAPETALELDRRITEGWLGAAGEVVMSHALHEDDRDLSPSPLITQVAEGRPHLPEGALRYADHRNALHASCALEPLPTGPAPALTEPRIKGGARVLADQSACPFRAFAAHRLAAEPLEEPADGLDAAARGTLLHALMKGVWDELKTQAALLDASPEELARVIESAAAAAVARVRKDVFIADNMAQLERERLARLAVEWLAVERGRSAFEVVASEDKRALTAGGLMFSGRIDRMDRLADGTHVLIDYKSGRVTPKNWEGERPQDPQLPIYAVNAKEPVSAVVFAKLKTGAMRFSGFSRDAKILPKVIHYRNWDQLLAGWKAELDRLGTAFSAGEAAVDPKKPGQTCRYCVLQPLCRVHERYAALALEANAAAEDGDESEAGE